MNASYATARTGLFDTLIALTVVAASIGVMVSGVIAPVLA